MKNLRKGCALVLSIAFLFLAGCNTKKTENLIWQTENFYAKVEGSFLCKNDAGEESEENFSATLLKKDGEQEICYSLPKELAGVSIKCFANGSVRISKGELSQTLSSYESVQKLLLPLLLMSSTGELKSQSKENNMRIFSFLSDDFTSEIRVQTALDGTPNCFACQECVINISAFSVLEKSN